MRRAQVSGFDDFDYFDDFESLDKHRQNWEKMHKRGAAYYVLVIGVLAIGTFTFIISTCFDVFVQHELLSPFLLIFRALLCSLNGLFWGAVTWHFSERRYFRAIEQQDLKNSTRGR